MKITLKQGLTAFGVALAVGFLIGLVPGEGSAMPLIFGMMAGAFTVYIMSNLSGNTAEGAADAETKRRALTFEAAPGRAALYLVRTGFIAKLAGLNVELDGKTVAQLKSPRFARLDIRPGQHLIRAGFGGGLTAQSNPAELSLQAKPGEVIVLQLGVAMGALKNNVQITRGTLDGVRGSLAGMKMVAAEGV